MSFKFFKTLSRLRNRDLIAIDLVIVSFSPSIALWLRLDGVLPVQIYAVSLLGVTALFLLLKLALFASLGFYRRCWRYASVDDLQQFITLAVVTIGLQLACFSWFYSTETGSIDLLPRSLPLLDGMVSFLLIGLVRLAVRAAAYWSSYRRRVYLRRDRVLVVGAGDAGAELVQKMKRKPELGFRPVAFIDDDSAKMNLQIHQIPVIGNRYSIPTAVRALHVRKIVIAMPSVPMRALQEILEICQTTGLPTTTVPGLNTLLDGPTLLSYLEEIQIVDVLHAKLTEPQISCNIN